MSSNPPPVIVWGNCQAEPLARLLEGPVAAAGWEIVHIPPVFLIDEHDLARVRNEILPRAAALISQPVRDEYRLPGCGTAQLAERLPTSAALVTIPNTYDTSGFPFMVNAHEGDGTRIDAPLTDYHDLRLIVAAERGLSVDEALAWWPAPTPGMVTANATDSKSELQRREHDLDVHVSDLLDGPAMFTLSHPT
ncbi:MAG TPA: WcbI family polysaccharide biosynthesis putative acetyltransferase, partial [Propionibacteriaceae bacterium]